MQIMHIPLGAPLVTPQNIDIQRIILDIFDYSYTNSPIKVPALTCREVGKILHTGMYLEEKEGRIPSFQFSPSDLKGLQGRNASLTDAVAKEIRHNYSIMNERWKLYEDEILFTNENICYVVGKLNNVYISDPDKDVFGDALELFRSQWAK